MYFILKGKRIKLMFLKLQSHLQMLDSDKSDKHNSLLCYRVNYVIKKQIKHKGGIFSHVWPFYEWAVSDLDP